MSMLLRRYFRIFTKRRDVQLRPPRVVVAKNKNKKSEKMKYCLSSSSCAHQRYFRIFIKRRGIKKKKANMEQRNEDATTEEMLVHLYAFLNKKLRHYWYVHTLFIYYYICDYIYYYSRWANLELDSSFLFLLKVGAAGAGQTVFHFFIFIFFFFCFSRWAQLELDKLAFELPLRAKVLLYMFLY